MKREIVFLLEERSAQAMLESLLPRVLCAEVGFRLVPFEGKQDLERQLTRKIRGYQNPHARFLVLRDQDSFPNCVDLQSRLLALCQASGRQEACLVRLACTELEAFYLADLQAVEQALEVKGLASQQQSNKFRAPDRLGSPSQELRTLTRNRYEKVAGSRAIGRHLRLDNDRSSSFHHLLTGIRRLESDLMTEL